MEGMFGGCRNLESIELYSFVTKNVKDMNEMFEFCTDLINIEFSSFFDTQNVQNMDRMFANCWSLLNINLSSFDFRHCKPIIDMFYDCFHLDKVIIKKEFYYNIDNGRYEIIKV